VRQEGACSDLSLKKNRKCEWVVVKQSEGSRIWNCFVPKITVKSPLLAPPPTTVVTKMWTMTRWPAFMGDRKPDAVHRQQLRQPLYNTYSIQRKQIMIVLYIFSLSAWVCEVSSYSAKKAPSSWKRFWLCKWLKRRHNHRHTFSFQTKVTMDGFGDS
jgi:hypothetical protein